MSQKNDGNYCLATTAIAEFWDLNIRLLFLGPWCLIDNNANKFIENKNYVIASSPWSSVEKRKGASVYCYNIYKEMIPLMSEKLNIIHDVTYPVKYWRILVGPWLLHFISILFDRYKRIEKVFELYPDFYTHVLPRGQCDLMSYSMADFLYSRGGKARGDYYNLKLFSLVAYDICPSNVIEKDYKVESEIYVIRHGWKRKLFSALKRPLDVSFKGPILLSSMHHLSLKDMFLLKMKMGFKNFHFMDFIDFKSPDSSSLKDRYSCKLRDALRFEKTNDRFVSLLYNTFPEAVPVCYVEDYKFHRNSVKEIDSLKLIGSAVGWVYNEEFKFYAAEALLKNVKLAEFQHGGVYGTLFSVPSETLALEKDIFYTWGWDLRSDSDIRHIPSAHLSKLKDRHSPRLDKMLFVSNIIPRYIYRVHTALLPDDVPKYLEDKLIFMNALSNNIKNRILYRPYRELVWEKIDLIKKICPDIEFVSKGKLAEWMRKAKIVVIDHPHTSFLEALTINVPSVFYWDHEVYLMRSDAEPYLQALRDAGILYKDPVSAAEKVNEIFDDPMEWWHSNTVQNVRKEFCGRFAYARKDWLDVWVKELRKHM